jgi:hypothetical protein
MASIAENKTGKRQRDEVRNYFRRNKRISICIFCNKRFSNPVTLALKGHLAGNQFNREFKTTACPSVPDNVREYYVNHLQTRRRNNKRIYEQHKESDSKIMTRSKLSRLANKSDEETKNVNDQSNSDDDFKENDENITDEIIDTDFFDSKAFDMSIPLDNEDIDTSYLDDLCEG